MASKRTARITRVSHEVWQAVQKQGAAIGDLPSPVSLGSCAKAFGIGCIRFEPLLSDAGLAKSGTKLEIVVNTEVAECNYPAGTTLSVDDAKWLDFAPALRFTIAHEIAHAAFLGAARWDKESDIAQRNRRAIEKACSILARSILLPRNVLKRELENRLFDVNHVSYLLSVLRVSPEVFLRRLHLSDMKSQYEDLDGFLAFLQETQETLKIKACHVLGTYAGDRFHRALERAGRKPKQQLPYRSLSDDYLEAKWVLEGCTLSDLRLGADKDMESMLRSNENGRVALEVGWAAGDIIPCDVTFLRIHHQPVGLLLRLQVTGPVQKPSQRRRF